MRVEGRCLCGACEWSAEVDPGRVFLCHCQDCQIQSSAPFRSTAVVDKEGFNLSRGELTTWVKTAESGATRGLAFCRACGTHVYGASPEEGGMMSLRVGPLDRARELKPIGQVWCRSRQAWLDELDQLPGLQTQPGVPE